MRYIMKKKVFSLAKKFAICDESGQEVYFVNGEVFTLGNKLSFEDNQGRELLYIRQKLMSFGHTYELFRGDELVGTIQKEFFTFFKCTFEIEMEGHGDLAAEGDFADHEYLVTRDGTAVAQISKQWFTWADTYGVDVAANEDPVLVLASTVVIDMCCHER